MIRWLMTDAPVLSRARLACHQWRKLHPADQVRLGMRLQDKSDPTRTLPTHFSALPDCPHGQFLAAWLMPIFLFIVGDSKLFFGKRRSLFQRSRGDPCQVQLVESDRYFEQWMSLHETR